MSHWLANLDHRVWRHGEALESHANKLRRDLVYAKGASSEVLKPKRDMLRFLEVTLEFPMR